MYVVRALPCQLVPERRNDWVDDRDVPGQAQPPLTRSAISPEATLQVRLRTQDQDKAQNLRVSCSDLPELQHYLGGVSDPPEGAISHLLLDLCLKTQQDQEL